MPTPEKSVEEIRRTPAYRALMTEWGQLDEEGISIAISRQALEETVAMFEEALQAERQKREEVVEAERKSFRKTLDNLYQESLENWAIDSDDYRKAINKMTIALTQPNSPK